MSAFEASPNYSLQALSIFSGNPFPVTFVEHPYTDVLGTVLSTLPMLSRFTNIHDVNGSTKQCRWHCPHFTDKEIQAQQV